MKDAEKTAIDVTALIDREVSRLSKEQIDPLVAGRAAEARGRLMMLSAAIVGLMAPLLSLNNAFAGPLRLKAAAISFLVSIAIGVIAEVTMRHRLKPLIMAILRDNHAKIARLALASGIQQLDAAKLPDTRDTERQLIEATNRVWAVDTRLQFGFYGAFFLGLCLLIVALF